MTAAQHIHPRPREKNGRHLRINERIAAEREAKRMVAVVLAQPHRRGDTSQARITPLGRMILDGMVTASDMPAKWLAEAADRLSGVYARERWLLDSRRPLAASSRGMRPNMTPEQRREIECELGDIRRVLRDTGPRVTEAIHAVYALPPDFDERIINTWIPRACGQGLAALVRFWGMGR